MDLRLQLAYIFLFIFYRMFFIMDRDVTVTNNSHKSIKKEESLSLLFMRNLYSKGKINMGHMYRG